MIIEPETSTANIRNILSGTYLCNEFEFNLLNDFGLNTQFEHKNSSLFLIFNLINAFSLNAQKPTEMATLTHGQQCCYVSHKWEDNLLISRKQCLKYKL